MTRLSDIKVLLDITDSSSDAKLTLIIAAIESRVEQATWYKIIEATSESGAITEVINGDTAKTVLLKWQNVTELKSFQYLDNDTWTDFDEDTYDIDLSAGIIYITSGTPRWLQNVRIKYNAGTSVQADVSDAVNELIIQRFTSGGKGIKSESVDGASVTYADNIDIKNHPVLSQYIRI